MPIEHLNWPESYEWIYTTKASVKWNSAVRKLGGQGGKRRKVSRGFGLTGKDAVIRDREPGDRSTPTSTEAANNAARLVTSSMASVSLKTTAISKKKKSSTVEEWDRITVSVAKTSEALAQKWWRIRNTSQQCQHKCVNSPLMRRVRRVSGSSLNLWRTTSRII